MLKDVCMGAIATMKKGADVHTQLRQFYLEQELYSEQESL